MFNNYLLMDTLTLASIFAFLVLISIIILSSEKSLAQAEPIQIISTRNHFDQFGNPLSNRLSYEPSPFDFQSLSCSQGEVVIYVHGVWTAKNKIDEDAKLMFENAPEIFDRVRLSLQSMEYRFPVIGFSWDSDTEISSNGWDYAKIIARENGPKLAQFILDLKDNCPETNIRLIAHSLGARVVLSSLDNLNNNQRWNDNNFTIASVHLMGAAVDNEKVSKSSFHTGDSHDDDAIVYGQAIEEEVSNFFNLFNSEDDALEPGYFTPWYFDCFFNYSEYQPIYYPCFEQDFALGQSGIQSTISDTDLPQNYVDIVVEQEIKDYRDADADGRCDLLYRTFWFHLPFVCTITQVGDNHLGYIGFRESIGSLRDNGAMNILVDTLQNAP
jgi:hypothetical protein